MTYTALIDLAGDRRVDTVRADDGSLVATGLVSFGAETLDLYQIDLDAAAAGDKGDQPHMVGDLGPMKAYRAWLAAGGKLGDPVPTPRVREAYGDDLITALSDAELAAMSGGTLRDQRMLSAQRVPFRATDDIIVRLAAAMKVDSKAWFARLPA